MTKVILITGGSGGIGKATALKAAKKGFFTCVHYHQHKDAAEAIAKQINDEGGKAIAVCADISKEDEVKKLFLIVDGKLGRITALVNNAGILGPKSKFIDISVERIQQIFATNVLGSFLCAKEAVKRMSLSNGGSGGSIVNISSMAAVLGSPGEFVDYAASKGAIDTFTYGLGREVATQGIRVNAVRPGVIYTGIHALGGEPERVDRIKELIPMKRGGHPDEVADTILWLLSDEASYITATLVDVAGGR
ncbi:MAG: SDR family oxidoreductase [Bacteroidia bacterium]|nr:SDR family oxidoreductase [Bacteroidia bacterium]